MHYKTKVPEEPDYSVGMRVVFQSHWSDGALPDEQMATSICFSDVIHPVFNPILHVGQALDAFNSTS